MPTSAKIAVSIDRKILDKIDTLVKKKVFPNRSKVIQAAVEEKISRIDKTRLSVESCKLSSDEEQKIADEGLKEDFAEWPEY